MGSIVKVVVFREAFKKEALFLPQIWVPALERTIAVDRMARKQEFDGKTAATRGCSTQGSARSSIMRMVARVTTLLRLNVRLTI